MLTYAEQLMVALLSRSGSGPENPVPESSAYLLCFVPPVAIAGQNLKRWVRKIFLTVVPAYG